MNNAQFPSGKEKKRMTKILQRLKGGVTYRDKRRKKLPMSLEEIERIIKEQEAFNGQRY